MFAATSTVLLFLLPLANGSPAFRGVKMLPAQKLAAPVAHPAQKASSLIRAMSLSPASSTAQATNLASGYYVSIDYENSDTTCGRQASSLTGIVSKPANYIFDETLIWKSYLCFKSDVS